MVVAHLVWRVIALVGTVVAEVWHHDHLAVKPLVNVPLCSYAFYCVIDELVFVSSQRTVLDYAPSNAPVFSKKTGRRIRVNPEAAHAMIVAYGLSHK